MTARTRTLRGAMAPAGGLAVVGLLAGCGTSTFVQDNSVGTSACIGIGDGTARALETLVAASSLTVASDGRAVTITAINDDDAYTADEAVLVPVPGQQGPGADDGSLSDIEESYPDGWAKRVPAIGATIEPGSTMLLVVPGVVEVAPGASQTLGPTRLEYREGWLTHELTLDARITGANGVCEEDPYRPGEYQVAVSDGGE